MTVTAPDGVCYDPYDVQINADPYSKRSLKRFPEWEVDLSCAELSPTSTVRGWEAMPAVLG